MKKIIALFLCIIIAVSLVSCGTADTPKKDAMDLDSIKTLGDYFKLEKDDGGFGYNNEYYIAVFKIGENTYRVAAKLTESVYNKMEEVDFFDEKRDEKFETILKDVEVFLVEDLEKYVPTDAELDALKGKTGQELLDEDFYECGYNFWDEQYFYMTQGMIEYKIYFNEQVTLADGEDLDVEETIKNMTVKKAEFFGFSGGTTDIETLP